MANGNDNLRDRRRSGGSGGSGGSGETQSRARGPMGTARNVARGTRDAVRTMGSQAREDFGRLRRAVSGRGGGSAAEPRPIDEMRQEAETNRRVRGTPNRGMRGSPGAADPSARPTPGRSSWNQARRFFRPRNLLRTTGVGLASDPLFNFAGRTLGEGAGWVDQQFDSLGNIQGQSDQPAQFTPMDEQIAGSLEDSVFGFIPGIGEVEGSQGGQPEFGQERVEAAETPEFGQERVRPATSLRRENGRVTMSMEDAQGGTGEISFDEGARLRTQRQLGTLGADGQPQGGTVSTMPADAITSVPPSQRAELRRARREAAERGDWEAVDRSFMTPEQQEAADREQRRQSLRRDIRQTRGADQTIGELMQERLRRQSARGELAGMAEQDELAAERQQQAFDNRIAMRDQRLEELDTRQDLSQQERENRLENIDRAYEFVDRVSTDQEQANDMSRFLTRTGIAEQGVEATRRGADLYEQLSALDQEAEVSSEDSTFGRILSGLGGAAGGIASIYAMARGGALARTAGVPGIVGSGALIDDAFDSDGQNFPTFETPEEAISALQELKDAGVEPQRRTRRGGPAIFPNETTEWRGQRINLSAMPPEMQQRLARILELVPEREQN